jgi:hypothetical protein
MPYFAMKTKTFPEVRKTKIDMVAHSTCNWATISILVFSNLWKYFFVFIAKSLASSSRSLNHVSNPFVLILHGTGRKENQYSLGLMAPLPFPILRASVKSIFHVVSSIESRGKMVLLVKICFILATCKGYGRGAPEWMGAELGTITQLGTVLCLQGFLKISIVRWQYFPVGFDSLMIHGKLELCGFVEHRNWGRKNGLDCTETIYLGFLCSLNFWTNDQKEKVLNEMATGLWRFDHQKVGLDSVILMVTKFLFWLIFTYLLCLVVHSLGVETATTAEANKPFRDQTVHWWWLICDLVKMSVAIFIKNSVTGLGNVRRNRSWSGRLFIEVRQGNGILVEGSF